MATALLSQKSQGDQFFEQQQYGEALKMYNLYDKIDKRKNTLVKRGICHYYENNLRKCIKDLANAHEQGYNDLDFYKYMSLALHGSGEYEDAALFYKRYLRKLDTNSPLRGRITHSIKQCGFARNKKYQPSLGYVENMGTFVNSKGDETSPIESPNFSNKVYFTSERKGYDTSGNKETGFGILSKDIYGSSRVDGVWKEIESIGSDINSSSNEIVLDFSANGTVLYFMSDMAESRMTILVDTFSENSAPNKFISPISPAQGDRDVIVYSDSIFIFSSNGRQGYGGYDLYMTRLNKDFYWSEPINLGPQINSSFNERSPYISRNGIRMFFSSDRKESFGGYDIFKTDFNKAKLEWGKPDNIGAPFNSPRHDLHFRLNKSGKSVFLSSNRSSGEGGYDIYNGYLKATDESQLKLNAELSFYQYYIDKQAFLNEYEQTKETPVVTNVESQINDGKQVISTTENNTVESPDVNPVIEKNVILVNPIYYDDDDDVRSVNNSKTIRDIARAYRQDRNLKIVLVSHSLAENFPEFDLFLSGKRGEKVIKEFDKEGVPEDAIILIGVGSNYPLMKDQHEGQRLKLSSTINRRIDIIPIKDVESPVDIKVAEPQIDVGLRDFKYDAFSKISSGLSYRIKVKEDSKMIDTGYITPFKDLVLEKRGKKFLYTLGMFKTFEEALTLYRQLEEKGISDLEIIPFIHLQEVQKGTLSKHFRLYPDLVEYMKFEQ